MADSILSFRPRVANMWQMNWKYCISLSLVASNRFLLLLIKANLLKLFRCEYFASKYSYNEDKNLKDHHQNIPEVHSVPFTVLSPKDAVEGSTTTFLK